MEEIEPGKRLELTKNLDVDGYLEEMQPYCDQVSLPTREQALVILHKARYWFARAGYLNRRYLIDSRRWLVMNGHKLPE